MPIRRRPAHGESYPRTPLYQTWQGIRDRRLRSSYYHDVEFADEWNDYAVFAEYVRNTLGERPTHEHSIDRIDNAKGYIPGNIHWASPRDQARNRTSNTVLTVNGQSKCIAEWAETTGLTEATICQRLKLGWADERAVMEPAGPTHTDVTYKGETHSISEWARIIGIKPLTLAKRLRPKDQGGGGWTVAEALGSGTGETRHRTQARKDADRTRSSAVMLEIDGVSQCVTAWAESSGTNRETIYSRLRRGISPREAVFGKGSK